MPRRPRDPGVPKTPAGYFGRELRAYRDGAGLSRTEFARLLGYTPQRIGQIEGGDPPSEEFAEDSDTHFKTNGTFHRLWEWIQEVEQIAILPAGFRPVARAERRASYIRIFEPSLIPGLLQTEEYARKVLVSGPYPDQVEERLAARMARQEILARDIPPRMLVVLSEAALRSLAPGREIMRGQLQHLLELAALPHITIEVIPLDAPVFQASEIILMGLEDGGSLAYVDAAGGLGVSVDEPREIERLAILFDQVRTESLTPEESERLIREVWEGC